ncbi:CHAD domain-containing protein [Burkholderia sp. WP9]|uniref:CHAD domain-containing protein n=1 Tax=Burkholderia sp. WP9 TaxID=1500263 RepID=UPI00089A39A7|nr:CHAD domain-containing protein [Burkholderia sp. WP9]SEB97403.1 CHAD domain-containing protein [Burkholderia sp. WP9]
MGHHRLPASAAETPASDSHHDKGDAGLLTSDAPVADAFMLLATSIAQEAVRRVRQLEANADPEVLHKLRVALRRLRSLWWAYQPLLDSKDARFQRGEFKSLADAAGRTRDWDILRGLLDAGPSMENSFASLIQLVDDHRSDALAFSRRTIGNAGIEQIVEQALAGARHQLDARPTSLSLGTWAEKRVQSAGKALEKKASRAASQNESGYAALHEVRIAGKKLRYLLEFFSPVLDGGHRATIERLTSVQDDLGTLNDLVTSETLLREYSLQLGEPNLVKEAIGYLQDQKEYYMHEAYEILRTGW